MTQGEDTIHFDYNESGLRTSKVVNGQKTEYIWIGDRLVAELAPSHSFYFHYDAAGEMIGYTYRPAGGNASECLLVKNLQGDVERVSSYTGSLLASYTYDAWGNLCQSSGSLAAINPIRYRSYYFDSETGLYYLQSRYYSPQVGRFVNADELIEFAANSSILNVFAYCDNSPLVKKDPYGNSDTSATDPSIISTLIAYGTASMLDGPLPFADVAALLMLATLCISQALPVSSTLSSTKANANEANYWSADLINKEVVAGELLNLFQASLREKCNM